MAKKGSIPWNAGTAKGYINDRGYLCKKINGREFKVHRLVMEDKLGRKLQPNELVHHKDGNKLNNDPENLELKEWGLHSIEHNTGSRRSEYTKTTMEVFANYREELRRINIINSELLEMLEKCRGLVLYSDCSMDEKDFLDRIDDLIKSFKGE